MSFKITINNLLKNLYKERDFSFLLLTLSLFLLPLSINFSTFSLVLSLVFKLGKVLFFKQKLFSNKALKFSSYIGLFFFIYIILNSFIQSSLPYTFKVFEREFFPLMLLFLTPILLRNKEDNKLLSCSLVLGLITACIYVFVLSFFMKIDFNKVAFSTILNIHHTYLSIYILFFVAILLSSISSKRDLEFNKKTMIIIINIVFAFIMLFVLGSKVSMVVYLIFIGAYMFTFFTGKKQFYFLVIFIPILFSCFWFFNQNINTSYKSALDFRVEIWKESITSIKENLFFGNLKMNENDVLNLKHYLSGKYYLMDSDLNSHNQFLSILLKYGFIGFIILLLFVALMFKVKNSTTSKKTIREVLSFFVIIFCTFYIENVLVRHHGIVFFAVFYNYYLVAIENEKT